MPVGGAGISFRLYGIRFCFAALMVSAGMQSIPSQSKIATRFAKGSPWMGPSFAWTDQDPRGPWTRCSTRPYLPLPRV